MSRAPDSLSSNAKAPSTSWEGSGANASGESTFGSYRLLGVLAEGEHCSVHRARSLVAPSSDVAIKRLRAPHERSARARLLREARIGLGLTDRHLVRVLALHDEPELYVVTQLVEGATLEQLLRAQLRLDALRFLLPMLVDVLHGLSALHGWRNDEGAPTYLVHQAVRARHILAGDDGVTRLIDLGDVHGSPFSGTAPVLPRQDGVETYAPEQFDASQGLDPRCDVFLTGTLLHDVLTRVGAARGPTWEALHSVAERARSPKRSARFWSAEEMAFTLQNAAIEAGVYASRPAIGAWVQALRAGVSTDSSRASGVRPRVDAALSAPAPERAGASDDDDELGFDVKTTAWERPLDPASLPPDLQVLLHEETPARPASPVTAARVLPPAARRGPTPAGPPVLLREGPEGGSWQRWAAALALAGLGFGLAALLGVRQRVQRTTIAAPASLSHQHVVASEPPRSASEVAAAALGKPSVEPVLTTSGHPVRVPRTADAPTAPTPSRAGRTNDVDVGATVPSAETRARPRASLPQNPY